MGNTYRTIRHACEWIEDNFNVSVPPPKVAVAPGNFEEIGPY